MMARVVLAAWAVVALVVIGGAIGFLCYTRVVLGITLRNQRGTLTLPPTLKVQATATRDIAIGLKGRVNAKVPVRQGLDIPLYATYKASLAMDARMPLRFTIDYRGEVPIKASALVEGTTDLVLHGKLVPKFPLKVRVPLNFMLPVHLRVPVDTMFNLNYAGPVFITFSQTVHAKVDAVLDTYLDVNQTVQTPILSSFGMLLRTPQTPQAVRVDEAHLKVPLGTLRLGTENRHTRRRNHGQEGN